MKRLLTALFLLISIAFPPKANATHLKGVHIYYDYVGSPAAGSYVYRIYVALYADCSGAAYSSISNFDINSFTIVPQGSCNVPQPTNIWYNLPVAIPNTIPTEYYTSQALPQGNSNIVVVQDITPYCYDLPNTCDSPGVANPNAMPGLSKHLWAREYVFTGQLCTDYLLRLSTCCRNSAIGSQIPQAASGGICLESRLRFPELGNSSPRWTTDPPPFLYNQQTKILNLTPFDPEGDAMAFSFDSVYNQAVGNGCPAYSGYTQGSSAADPIPSLLPTGINSFGSVSLHPNAALGDYAFNFAITETRDMGGIPTVVSVIHREVDFTLLPLVAPDVVAFNSSLPTIDSVQITINSPVVPQSVVTISQPLQSNPIEIQCYTNDAIDARFWVDDTGYVVLFTGDTLIDSVTAYVNFPTSMATAVFNAPIFPVAPLVQADFDWTPTQPGIYDFLIVLRNSLCPLPMENNYTVRITVIDTNVTGSPLEAAHPSTVNLSPNPCTSFAKLQRNAFAPDAPTQVVVIDAAGREVLIIPWPASDSSLSIDVQGLAPSIYSLRGFTSQGAATFAIRMAVVR